MQSAENVFAKEFLNMMNCRKSINSGFSLQDIPLPTLHLYHESDFVGNGRICTVTGIIENYFSDLNGSEVQLVGKDKLEKRVSMKTEDGASFRKDAAGNYVTTQVVVKSDFVAVYSKRNIKLPNKVLLHNTRVDYKTKEDGYKYVDYVDTDEGRKYIYLIPKRTVYPLELCGLVIAFNKHRAYYKGCKVALTNGFFVYIYVIPYKYRENQGYRLIGAKASVNFDDEVSEILSFWQESDVLFDLQLTSLENQFKGLNNLGIEDIPGTCFADDYKRVLNSLQEENGV